MFNCWRKMWKLLAHLTMSNMSSLSSQHFELFYLIMFAIQIFENILIVKLSKVWLPMCPKGQLFLNDGVHALKNGVASEVIHSILSGVEFAVIFVGTLNIYESCCIHLHKHFKLMILYMSWSCCEHFIISICVFFSDLITAWSAGLRQASK